MTDNDYLDLNFADQYYLQENETEIITLGFNNMSAEDSSQNGGGRVIEPPMYIVVTSTLLYCIIFIIGVIGNILVIVVIVYGRSMRTSVNMYLANLCVADVLVILVCMPTALADIFTREIWYFGEFMCEYIYLNIENDLTYYTCAN